MSVPARSNAFANDVFYEQRVSKTKTIYASGATHTSQSALSQVVHDCERRNYTSNPLRDIGGIPNIRPCAGYQRKVTDMRHRPETLTETRNYTGTNPNAIVGYDREKWYNPSISSFQPPGWTSAGFAAFDVGYVNELEVKALNKLGDQRANLGEAIAQGKQALNLVGSSTIDLCEALLHLRRGNPREAARRLGIHPSRISERYIQYEYGWKPLMSDIYGSVGLLQEILEDDSRLPIISASSSRHDSRDYPVTLKEWRPNGKLNASMTTTVSFTAKLDNWYDRRVNQAGLANPVSLGWDLIPFSFVIDWVVPVGQVLQAMTATSGLTFLYGYKHVVVNYNGTAKRSIASPPSGFYRTSEEPASVEVNGFGFRRSAYGGFPRPKPYIRSPFTTDKAVKALALIDLLTRRR